MSRDLLQTTCCIVGGGPAGVMLGYLLARAGVEVTILEKHRDFFRDFRGDTVHPSTLELLYELNLLEEFLEQPHQKVTSVGVKVGDFAFEVANFGHLRTRCRFAVIMPQWDFLNFLAEEGKKYSNFHLRMEHEAVDLVYEHERVRGVLVRTSNGTEQIGADLVIACDGRHSIIRAAGHLPVRELGVPIDVLWFRISRRKDDHEQVLGNIDFGKMLVLINRNEYFQAGLIIPKNSFEQIKQKGLEAFRQDISQIAPFLRDRLGELRDWEQVQLLSVRINRLKRWHRPGLLCIGDAAHAMSPVFGIGINLAIQDAVAAANVLAGPLRHGRNTDDLLQKVQCRREFRTRLTQSLQVIAHAGFQYVFRRQTPLHPSWPVKLVARTHVLQPILLRVVGLGIVPEHVSEMAAPNRRIGTKIASAIGLGAGVAAGATVLWLGLRSRLPAKAFRF
jgi:2-polyprenyl-6-methoxyphenol hydroxylase-like FAD-dependent oxidoreductase